MNRGFGKISSNKLTDDSTSVFSLAVLIVMEPKQTKLIETTTEVGNISLRPSNEVEKRRCGIEA